MEDSECMVKWRGGKQKIERAAPHNSRNLQTLNIQILLRNVARRRSSACSKYNINQVHLISLAEFKKRALVVQLG